MGYRGRSREGSRGGDVTWVIRRNFDPRYHGPGSWVGSLTRATHFPTYAAAVYAASLIKVGTVVEVRVPKDVSDMTPAEWRTLLAEAAESRCIACGHTDECECSDEVDAAKDHILNRAVEL